VGTQSSGQGHIGTYRTLVAQRLQIAPDVVRVIQGDSDQLVSGGGTGGSRSLSTQGAALVAALAQVMERGRAAAAALFACDAAAIGYADGVFSAGTRRIALAELARQGGALDAVGQIENPSHNFPNGCHVAEVEVDAETGKVRLLRYTVADDFGNVLQPAIVVGQVHGGAVQGIGQALLEHAVYDAQGQLQSGSLMDYGMPHAHDIPPIAVSLHATPCTTNALGVKGAGEAGAVGAAAAVINAVVDALSGLGITHIEMPATPARVWAAIQAARQAAR